MVKKATHEEEELSMPGITYHTTVGGHGFKRDKRGNLHKFRLRVRVFLGRGRNQNNMTGITKRRKIKGAAEKKKTRCERG